jgi:hypothetical protein
VSSRFSASNIKRGLKALALSVGITVVTYFIGMPIWFGVLHLLGFSMVFYGLTFKFWDFIHRSLNQKSKCLDSERVFCQTRRFFAVIIGL